MNKLMPILLLLSFNASAIDVWEGGSAQIDCTPPTAYTNGDPIADADTITYKLYQDGVEVQAGEPTCSFAVSPPVGSYLYQAKARSAIYSSDSALSDDNAVVNVTVKKRPAEPAKLTATVVPQAE